ncbi:sensor histidine kinase [Lutibacter sp. A80]|uniref:tetratricopeptide repeat-containing sensor histidine kinase n=1 Tax=Lutibacter sp. A80 TaxID=2918453 RepID=UPI001F07055A|nr:tetratricopeptide repeat protein [Lutibacter sp. A80]UMB59750.1 sensor histidine kinase [Lutibacter sp. A80]
MKIKILFCYLILITTIGYSQNKNNKILDSLLQVSKTQKEVQLIKTLNDISWEFKNSNIDSAFFYARKSLKISKNLNQQQAIASSYNSLANCFDAKGILDSALTYHKKSLAIKLKIGQTIGAADSYNNIGIAYDLKGDFARSLESYFKALKIYEEEQNVPSNKLPMVLGNIGIVYKKQKEYDKVLNYYKKALNIYEENNSPFGIVVTKGNIGSVLLSLEKYNESISYSEEAKTLYSKLGYERYVPYMLNNIAIAKDSLKLRTAAQHYYKEAIVLFTKDQNLYELAHAQIGLAKSLVTEKKYSEAISVVNNALKTTQEKGFKEFEIKAYKLLANIESKLGNHKQAYNYYEAYAVGKDSLFVEEKTKTIFELETKYETEKKEKEIAEQKEKLLKNELEIKNKNLTTLLLGSGLLVFTIISFGLYKRQQHKKREYKNKLALKEAQTYNKLQDQRLRISRDLHDNIGSQLTFIISSIDNLKFLSDPTNKKLLNKLSEINNFASTTISELRDTIWAMNTNKISFDNLQGRILSFIEKAKSATNNSIHFNINIKVTSELLFSSVKGINIFRVIQEAINNAIKYAEASEITLQILENETSIKFEITDNGKGFNINTTRLGNGLENMERRIKEIDGEITINSQPNNGTSIIISCPKNRTNVV